MTKNKQNTENLYIEHSKIKEFGRLISELQTFYNEINLISKKNPNESLSVFKIGLINETVTKSTIFLGKDYIPFPSFEKFNIDEIPTASDVCVVLSQYINSMNRFEKKHTYFDEDEEDICWYTKGGRPFLSSEIRDGSK